MLVTDLETQLQSRKPMFYSSELAVTPHETSDSKNN